MQVVYEFLRHLAFDGTIDTLRQYTARLFNGGINIGIGYHFRLETTGDIDVLHQAVPDVI